MSLDIRFPIGAMFSLFGIILMIFGLVSKSSDIYSRSLGININLWWGIVLLAFGAVMLLLAWKASPQKKND